MLPGWEGIEAAFTFSSVAELDPQLLAAFTLMIPDTVVAVALMELLVELPLQPAGSVQVYSLAPATGNTE